MYYICVYVYHTYVRISIYKERRKEGKQFILVIFLNEIGSCDCGNCTFKICKSGVRLKIQAAVDAAVEAEFLLLRETLAFVFKAFN